MQVLLSLVDDSTDANENDRTRCFDLFESADVVSELLKLLWSFGGGVQWQVGVVFKQKSVRVYCNHYFVQFLHRTVHRRLHLRSLGFYVSQARGCKCIRLLCLCRAVRCFVFVFGLNVVDVLYWVLVVFLLLHQLFCWSCWLLRGGGKEKQRERERERAQMRWIEDSKAFRVTPAETKVDSLLWAPSGCRGN